MGVRVIGVKITGSNASLDQRLNEAKASIRAFAKEVETGQRGATKSMGATEAATARLGATAEKTAQRTRTSSRTTATGMQAVGIATGKAADQADRHAKIALRLSEYYSVGGLRVAAGLGLASAAAFMLGRQLITAFTGGIQLSAQFEAQMRNVNSITGMSEAALGGLSQSVLDLSKTLPQEATVLAAGLYDIASSGFQGAAGLQVLDASAKAASAGISTTAVAAQAISGVLNAYGLSASSAKDVSDTLFQTVNLGVLSFDQLGQNLGDVIGTASAAGISIDGVGQAIATMTKAGIKPAEAFTALNQLMAQLITPGDALAGVYKSLGYESGAAALESKGLNGVMADLQRVTGGNVTTMSSLFTDIRSLKGALALTSDQGKLYTGVIAGWSAAHAGAGATAVALAEQMKSASAQWALVVNAIKAGTIEVGLKLLPVLTTLMKSMMDLAKGCSTRPAGRGEGTDPTLLGVVGYRRGRSHHAQDHRAGRRTSRWCPCRPGRRGCGRRSDRDRPSPGHGDRVPGRPQGHRPGVGHRLRRIAAAFPGCGAGHVQQDDPDPRHPWPGGPDDGC